MSEPAHIEIDLPEHVADWLMATSASYGHSIPEAIACLITEAYEHSIAEASAMDRLLAEGVTPNNAQPAGGYMPFPGSIQVSPSQDTNE